MTTLPQTPAVHEPDPAVRARSLIVASRLMLAANVSLQLAFLFAFLYLRANNNNSMWHPDGVGPPPVAMAVAILIVQAVSFAVVWLAWQEFQRRPAARAFAGVLAVGLLLGAVGVGLRVFQMTHLDWTPDEGTYVDISVLWFFVVAAEVFIGCLWFIRLLAGHLRRTVPIAASDLRSLAEYWAFVTVLSIGVFALVQFVT